MYLNRLPVLEYCTVPVNGMVLVPLQLGWQSICSVSRPYNQYVASMLGDFYRPQIQDFTSKSGGGIANATGDDTTVEGALTLGNRTCGETKQSRTREAQKSQKRLRFCEIC